MPIYEYHCRACDHEFEEMQKITDGPLRKCPECAALKLERLVSRSSFQLKGGGWYVTEYGGKKASGGDSASSKSKPAKKEKAQSKVKTDTSAAKPSASSD